MSSSLVTVAKEIWQAGVNAVDPARLIREQVTCDQASLRIANRVFDLSSFENICVVGGGKASARMAIGLEEILETVLGTTNVSGTVVVPASQVQNTRRINLVAGRESHENLPTPQAVAATQTIIRQVSSLGPDDLCIALISGGGSALLCAPIPGISLAEKIQVTRLLSDAGASIDQLNIVRSKLSRIKRGGLARLCPSSPMIGLVLSDVMSDRLESVASGPTVNTRQATWDEIAAIFEELEIEVGQIPPKVIRALRSSSPVKAEPSPRPTNHLLGNNRNAIDEAAKFANSKRFRVITDSLAPETNLNDLAKSICTRITEFGSLETQTYCCVIGGEPTAKLVSSNSRGKGGRNQQLVLEVWKQLKTKLGNEWPFDYQFCFLSGGTDGEDGPTDAAGAWIESTSFGRANLEELENHLDRNNAYPLLNRLNQLHQPGETGTNVCDLIVLLIKF